MISCRFENGKETSLRHVAVHAIVEKDGKLLLVRRAPTLSLEAGKWALPGGFLDRDETGPQGALRELKEETGWEGEVTRLFLINTAPNRPHEDRQNVAFHYLVRPLVQTGPGDSESSEISWMSPVEFPPSDVFAFDLGDAIARYLEWKILAFPLPLIF